MTGYSKLFASIITSSLWQEDDATRLVFIALLAIKDKDGFVPGSAPGIAHIARVPLDKCRVALAKLESPDADSRSPDHEGRRIERVEGGWIVLNHEKYRAMGARAERTDYLRDKQREHRAKKAPKKAKKSSKLLTPVDRQQTSTDINKRQQTSTSQPQADTDTDTQKIGILSDTGAGKPGAGLNEPPAGSAPSPSEGQPPTVSGPEPTEEEAVLAANLGVSDDESATLSPSGTENPPAGDVVRSKAIAEPAHEPKPGKSEAKAEETQRFHDFNAKWEAAFRDVHGSDYLRNFGRDGKAAKHLLHLDVSVDDLIATARAAWARDTFFCKHAATIPGFDKHYNGIVAELNKAGGAPGSTTKGEKF